MKTVLQLLFLLCFFTSIAQTYVPDDVFEQKLIDLGYDSGPLDDYVPTANINTVTNLLLNNLPIVDLTGIEDFTALDYLFIQYSNITALDLSSNLLLTRLNCNSNNISALNVNGLTNLEEIILYDNSISNIDLSTNTALKLFNGGFNPYTTLDFSNNPNMEWIGSPSGNLTSINLTGVTTLVEVYINDNQLSTLDISGNPNLLYFDAFDNNISSINLTGDTALQNLFIFNNQLTVLDVSTNTSLISLNCSVNQLTTIDLSTNINLSELAVSNNNLASINLSTLNGLIELRCQNNQLTNLDVSNNTALYRLISSNNALVNLDLTQNVNMQYLQINDNNLSAVDLKNANNNLIASNWFDARNNPSLFCIQVDDEAFSTVNWANIDPQTVFAEDCTAFVQTYVPDDAFEQYLIDNGFDSGPLDNYVLTSNINTITTLNVLANSISDLTGIEDFIMLQSLDCSLNQLTSLDLSQNIALTSLNCSSNQLTSIDLSQNIGLTFLNSGINQLTTLNLDQNTVLLTLNCESNQLTNIDLIQNLSLDNLDVSNNQLTSLDLSQNSSLVQIEVGFNNLTDLNVRNGNNSNFIVFVASNNPNLFCIEVDDENYSTANWTNIDPQTQFSEDCTLGFDDFSKLEVSIYPNPTSEIIHISLTNSTIVAYTIMSVNGRVIVSEKLSENMQINISQLQTGMYFIELKDKNNRKIIQKFIKQ